MTFTRHISFSGVVRQAVNAATGAAMMMEMMMCNR